MDLLCAAILSEFFILLLLFIYVYPLALGIYIHPESFFLPDYKYFFLGFIFIGRIGQ